MLDIQFMLHINIRFLQLNNYKLAYNWRYIIGKYSLRSLQSSENLSPRVEGSSAWLFYAGNSNNRWSFKGKLSNKYSTIIINMVGIWPYLHKRLVHTAHTCVFSRSSCFQCCILQLLIMLIEATPLFTEHWKFDTTLAAF